MLSRCRNAAGESNVPSVPPPPVQPLDATAFLVKLRAALVSPNFIMLRTFVFRVFVFAAMALPLGAKEFQWFPSGGDGSSFSDPGNWYDLDPNVFPHNPAGPPGAGDTADLASSANVTVGSANIGKLTGSGTSTITVGGILNVGETNTRLTLKGGGKLIAGSAPIAPVVVGGNLEATSFLDRAISVTETGTVRVNGALIAPAGDRVNIFVRSSSQLTVIGDAADIVGAVESGGQALFLGSLANLNTSKPTLSVEGAGSRIDVEGDVLIHDGSLDAGPGGKIAIAGVLALEGDVVNGQVLTGASHWQGDGAAASVTGNLFVGTGSGAYDLAVRLKATATIGGDAKMALLADAKASVSVEDAGSELLVVGNVEVGVLGDAVLNVKAGAKASFVAGGMTAQALRVGVLSGSDGLVEVTGGDAQLILSGFNVNLADAAGSKAVLRLNDGQFQMTGGSDLIIGNGGNGQLSLRNGSNLGYVNVNGVTTIGAQAGGEGSFLAGDAGTGAAFQGTVIVGVLGTGVANVFGGAIVTSHSLTIGTHGALIIDSAGEWHTATTTAVGGLVDGVAGTGLLTVQSGGKLRTSQELFLSDKGIVTVLDTGRIAVGQGAFGPAGSVRVELGRITGKGRIRAPILVGPLGEVRPGSSPGTLTVEGDYTHDGGGTLEIELGGPGANSDLLEVTGTATLTGGKLKVGLTGGFNPKAGQKFKVLTAASRVGQFAEVEGADVEYTDDGITVTPFVITSTLTVTVNPLNPNRGGKVSAGFEGQSARTVGFTYKMTATPAKGFVFAGWTGALTSTNPALTFVMEENMTLQANFVANPFAPQFLGAYEGLADNSGAGGLAAGLFKIKLTKTGSFSAKFLLAGKTYNFAGLFTGLGKYTRQVKAGGKLLDVALDLDLAGADTVTGTITLDGQTFAVATDRATFHAKDNATDRAGAYTLQLPPGAAGPRGHGWATASITPAGLVKVAGKLADGIPFTAAGPLAKDGTFALFTSLYKGLGVLAGTLTFAPPPRDPSPAASDASGILTWEKPQEIKNKIFPDPFATTLDALGSFYVPPGKDQRALPGLDASGTARLRFLGADLPGTVTKDILISTKNTVTYPAPLTATDKLKLTFTARTGAFAGSFLHPGTGKTKVFTGVLLQKQERGAGHFLDSADSGQVELAAP